jgi:hypothetical protein
VGNEPVEYCRQIEAYLCRKNDGHLVRVVGPSFDIVSRWAAGGVPLKVAYRGIDRYFERYYRSGPRRRPVRIDFCEADVMDVFDEWRRAIGLPRSALVSRVDEIPAPASHGTPDDDPSLEQEPPDDRRGPSLPSHLERAMLRLTDVRAAGVFGDGLDSLLDRLSRELDLARGAVRGLRGDARRAAIERLSILDAELLRMAYDALGDDDRVRCEREADEELEAFRERLPAGAYRRARAASIDRLVRERFGLPTLSFA